MNKVSFVFSIAFIAFLLQGCSSSRELANADEGKFYSSPQLQIEPNIKIYHQNGDTSTVFVKFDTENLLYVKEDEVFEASVILEIDPVGGVSENSLKPKEKTVSVPPIPKSKRGKKVMVKTDVILPEGGNYNLAITIRDESNGKRVEKLINVDKSGKSDRENFLVVEAGDSIPLFGDRVKSNNTYELEFARLKSQKVYVNYYNRSFPLPPPPFAYYEPKPFDYIPDDRFFLEADDSGKYQFTTSEEGFYHFRVDTTMKEGFTLFVSSDEFPEVQNVQNMLDPFRYLVSGKEYKQILEASDLKSEIEKHWIDWAGDRGRARDNIEAYYNRVERANRLFSSHLEGWKSDRGLIYIIYGEPDKVYKTAQLESWIYGEERNPLSITFRFVKVDNPFTENDFRLSREDYYKPSWYRYIEAWRNGRLY